MASLMGSIIIVVVVLEIYMERKVVVIINFRMMFWMFVLIN